MIDHWSLTASDDRSWKFSRFRPLIYTFVVRLEKRFYFHFQFHYCNLVAPREIWLQKTKTQKVLTLDEHIKAVKLEESGKSSRKVAEGAILRILWRVSNLKAGISLPPASWARSVLQISQNCPWESTSAEQPPLLSSQKRPIPWVAA